MTENSSHKVLRLPTDRSDSLPGVTENSSHKIQARIAASRGRTIPAPTFAQALEDWETYRASEALGDDVRVALFRAAFHLEDSYTALINSDLDPIEVCVEVDLDGWVALIKLSLEGWALDFLGDAE